MIALADIAVVGLIWVGTAAAIVFAIWRVKRAQPDYGPDRTAPAPPFPRCLPTETWRGRHSRQHPAVQAEIAELEHAYRLPAADIDR
jgi:hypothetical protein